MPRRYWIALAAIGLTFIWSPLGDGQEAPQDPPAEPAGHQEQTATQPAIEPEAANAEVRPAETPSHEHYERPATNGDEQSQQSQRAPLSMGFLGDGWAQWAMALFSLIALLISAWAVWLLQETLTATRAAVREAESATKAAQDAVEVTRQIGNAQTRAYLSIPRAYVMFPTREEIQALVADEKSINPEIRFTIENHGPSPAKEVHWNCGVDYTCVIMTGPGRGAPKMRSSKRRDIRESARTNEALGVAIPPKATPSNEFVMGFPLDEVEIKALVAPVDMAKFIFGAFFQTLHEDVF